MTQPMFSRRSFLLGAGAAAIGGPSLLAACGNDGGSGSGGSGTVNMANWPLYIEDDEKPANSATLKGFTDATKIKVNYKVAVDDNNDFTEKSRGQLEKGTYIGYDLAVLTSWMVARWIANGWVETFDAANMPNKANVLDRMANPPWDPGRTKSLPYAIGQVGIAYYPEKVGFEITSVKQLLDPRIKGRVTLLSEARDSTGLFMLANGADPSKPDLPAAKAAIEEIRKARDAGQFRAIKGNSYIEDLDLGDVWAAVAWSGDVASIQQQHPDLSWVLPSEGAMSFVDTIFIPKAAKNKAGAEKLIDHFYDPAVSGPLFESIQYVSPVKGAGEKMSADAAKNPLINPPAEAEIYEFADLTEAQSTELEEAFIEATKL